MLIHQSTSLLSEYLDVQDDAHPMGSPNVLETLLFYSYVQETPAAPVIPLAANVSSVVTDKPSTGQPAAAQVGAILLFLHLVS